MSFNNKVVIITGGGSGIGAATAELFVKEGANVIVIGRDETKLNRVAEQCSHLGTRPMTVKADVSQDGDVSKIINETINRYGKIDILVNNAGVLRQTGILDDTFMEAHDKLMNINYRAVVLLSKLALPYLIKTKGNIVNVSSIASVQSSPANFIAYKVSKAALDCFTKTLALEVSDKGVRVNSVNPGPVRTNIFEAGRVFIDEEALRKVTVLDRISEPEEIAEFIAFLASEKARGVTGSIVFTDNGALLKQ